MGSVPAWGTKIPQAKRGGQKEKRQRNWVDSFPKCPFHGQQVHGKIVNIANHQGNANRFSPVEWQSPRRRQLTRAGKNVETRESLCIVTSMENSMEVTQTWREELPYHLAIPLLDVYQKEVKTGSQRIPTHRVHCNNSRWRDEEGMVCTHGEMEAVHQLYLKIPGKNEKKVILGTVKNIWMLWAEDKLGVWG